MYDEHYELSGRPFQLTPDPRFWFETATHRKAMAYLGYGLAQGEGFIIITGDVGAGKTTLVGHLMDTVDATRLHVIRLVSTQIEAEDLLRMVAGGLDVDSAGMTKAQLLVAIERGLHATARGGRRTLLIVDEAQALPVTSLEELRMLSNFQTGGHALLQIFLLGQPEFRERLHGSDRLEQLRQRVIAMHHLDPMAPDEVEPYMRHRLSVVGWRGRPHFTADAFAALHAGSDGVPRRLNQLAGRVLLYGAIEQLETIDAKAVAEVIADIAGDMPALGRLKPVAPAAPVPPPEPVADESLPVPDEPLPVPDEPLPLPDEPLPLPDEPLPVPDEPLPVADEPLPVADEPLPVADEPLPLSDAALPHFDAPLPLPILNVAPPAEPRPIRGSAEPPAPKPAPAAPDPDLEERIAQIEVRVEEQDAAMRRVLTLLVDRFESEQRPTAPAPAPRETAR